MSEEKGKFERTKKLREALKKSKGEAGQLAGKIGKQIRAAAAATKEVGDALSKPFSKPFKKNNHRTAKARDIRSKKRGRMPLGTAVAANWVRYVEDGKIAWCGSMSLAAGGDWSGSVVKRFTHEADGLFRLMEELDCMFWEWFAKEATADQKARLTFAPDPPAPAPWLSPPASEGTEPESH